MNYSASSGRITLTQFTNVFVLFAALVLLALWAPELGDNPTLYRTIYTIWVATVLLTPALVCYLFYGASPAVDSYWRLFWTFSYVAYLIHFYYAVFVVFDGVADSIRMQGPRIAIPNYILTIWWGFDVILLWFFQQPSVWVRVQRFAAHLFVFAVFCYTTLVLKDGFVRVLGIVMTAAVVVAVVVRLIVWSRDEPAAGSAPAAS